MATMAWFRKKKKTYNSETLRDALFTAISQGDGDEFTDLCNQNASLIFQYFDDWRQVPETIRQDPEAVNEWGNCLFTIASIFEDSGYPELRVALMGHSEDNRFAQWVNTFNKAHHLSDTGKYEESNAALLEILTEMQGITGRAIDEYRPKVYGLLGTNFFRINNLSKARQYTEHALTDCERTGDRGGVAAYTENLAIILAADPESSVAQCRKNIAKAQDLSDQMRYEYSNTILREVLADIKQNPELRSYRSKVYGLMGLNHFRLDDLQHAKKYTELAVHDCEADGDDKGIRIYKENLRVISET
jgi:tetratricopeptide (TPR) repeat protein